MGRDDVQQAAHEEPLHRRFQCRHLVDDGRTRQESHHGQGSQCSQDQQLSLPGLDCHADADADRQPMRSDTHGDGGTQTTVQDSERPVHDRVEGKQEQSRACPDGLAPPPMQQHGHPCTDQHGDEGGHTPVGHRIRTKVEQPDSAHEDEHHAVQSGGSVPSPVRPTPAMAR